MTTAIVSYALAASGLAMLVVVIAQLQMRRLTIAAATNFLVTQLRGKHFERAIKICSTVPGTFFDAMRAALAALPESKDRITVEACVVGAFEPAAKQFAERWQRRSDYGLVGAFLVAGGVAVQISDGAAQIAIYVVGGIGAIGLLWLLALRGHANAGLAAMRRDVLPVLVEAATAPQ